MVQRGKEREKMRNKGERERVRKRESFTYCFTLQISAVARVWSDWIQEPRKSIWVSHVAGRVSTTWIITRCSQDHTSKGLELGMGPEFGARHCLMGCGVRARHSHLGCRYLRQHPQLLCQVPALTLYVWSWLHPLMTITGHWFFLLREITASLWM